MALRIVSATEHHMGHGICYACDPRNPDRMVFEGGRRISVPERFRGLPGYLNGGIAVGLLACPALELAAGEGVSNGAVTRITARLTRPLPLAGLSTRAERTAEGFWVELAYGDATCASGTVRVVSLGHDPIPGRSLPEEVPAHCRPDVEAMARATPSDPLRSVWVREGLPADDNTAGCFSCGPANRRGLRVLPRVVGPREVCAPWHPQPEFADAHGCIPPIILAAAMDCSSGWSMAAGDRPQLDRLDEGFVLGTFDVRFLRLAPAGVPDGYQVTGRWLRRDGRKFYAVCALFDGERTLYAFAEAIWVIVPPETA